MLIRKLLLITAAFLIAPTANALHTDALLNSIGAVETGHDFRRIGAAGERSEYQIKRSTWVRYSRVPFWMASQKEYRDEAARVAVLYVEELIRDTEQDGVESSIFNIASRWNGGPNKTRYSSHNKSYGRRVSNIYTDYVATAPVATPLIPRITILVAATEPDVAPAIRIDLNTPLVPALHVSVGNRITMPYIIATIQ